ncbi:MULTISPECIES: hypothetical protein [unclassified Mesorhizobium]|nr:hypothetical protein [Mesorhizobium sp. L2C066B000]
MRLAGGADCCRCDFRRRAGGDPPRQQFHAIVAGEAYRSAQPTADEICAYRDKYHIAAIVNLRGAAPGHA